MDAGGTTAVGEEASPEEREGGIPWGEWDAATRDTAVRGWVGCRNARIDVRPVMSICDFRGASKRTHQSVTRYIDSVRINMSG